MTEIPAKSAQSMAEKASRLSPSEVVRMRVRCASLIEYMNPAGAGFVASNAASLWDVRHDVRGE